MIDMNTVTILITMPKKKGDPTEFTYQWAEKAVQIAKDLGYTAEDGQKAQRRLTG